MEVMYPDKKKGRKGGESKGFTCELWPLHCKKCDDVLILSAAFRCIAVAHQCVFSVAFPAAYRCNPEGLDVPMRQRNRKELKAFYSILTWHLTKKAFIHRRRSVEVWGQGTKEGGTRGKQQNIGRRGKNQHKWQMDRNTQAWSQKLKKKLQDPFETIKDGGAWTSNLMYERQGWTCAGLWHLIGNGAAWLYPRRSSEAKKEDGDNVYHGVL